MTNEHPQIKLFRSAIARNELTPEKIVSMEKWVNGSKCSEADKAIAGPLIEQAKAKGPSAMVNLALKRDDNRRDARGSINGVSATQAKGDNQNAADPSCIGEPFHNPYTFLPFPKNPPPRHKPTPMSIDEIEADRFTGVLQLSVRTASPLLSADPIAASGEKGKHQSYRALTVGNDAIVPATGVRGALRALMSAITGGTLGYLDENLWLCQGRDATLGPAQRGDAPKHAFLAKVTESGNAYRPGKVQLGETRLVLAESLQQIMGDDGLKNARPRQGKCFELWIDNPDNPCEYSPQSTDRCVWQVKLSGRPVNQRGKKKEGAFRAHGAEIELPPQLWTAYQGRNRHGDFGELRKGWLVWLEPSNPNLTAITTVDDVESIQWARWGRRGESFKELLQKHHAGLLPDSMTPDGMVDTVTDLFGQVPLVPGAAPSFAGRIRPSNLVFQGGANRLLKAVTLAPLMQPHPGCVAFYHENPNLDEISQQDALKGYKVYRNTIERGSKAPWNYSVQGVYDRMSLKPPQQSCNKTCDLLDEGVAGTLELTCYGLDKRELALLLYTCTLDLRLGGGKPLGLGHCQVTEMKLADEAGHETPVAQRQPSGLALPAEWLAHVDATTRERAEAYQASQKPVDRLRYPRAIKKDTLAGHVWFSRHAATKKGERDGEPAKGLQTLWTDGALRDKAGGKGQICAQSLPAAAPGSDGALYGYDCASVEAGGRDKRTLVGSLEPPASGTRLAESPPRHENVSQNRDSRQAFRQGR